MTLHVTEHPAASVLFVPVACANSSASFKSVSSMASGPSVGSATNYRSFSVANSVEIEDERSDREWVRVSKKPIFEGANGIIYKGLDAANTTFVVIKTVKRQPWQTTETYRKAVIREHANLAKCKVSKYVVDVLDIVVCDACDDLSLVIQYCPKGDLLDLLSTLRSKKITMPTPLKDAIFKQVVRGVEFLHRNDIVHRDLKPENFLIDAQGLLKLNDFGCSVDLAKTTEQLPLNGLNCGTSSFKAPELFRLESQAEKCQCADPEFLSSFNFKSVDVWALGIVCFHLYLMSVPWTSANLVPGELNKNMEAYTKHFPELESQLRGLADHLNDKNYPTLLNPALSLFKKIHYDARLKLLAMLHPSSAKRPTAEQLLQSSWLTQAYAKPGEILTLMKK